MLILLCVITLMAIGFYLAWMMFMPTAKLSTSQDATESPTLPQLKSAALPHKRHGATPGWLSVLADEELLDMCGAKPYIEEMLRQSRLAKEVFEKDLLNIVRSYAEFVQLLPASEAHHHAHAGGLLAHTIEVLSIAMKLRNSYLLPEGGGAEIIDQQRDHWTYAIFLAALFHDIGKPVADLRIMMRVKESTVIRQWMPVTGSLIDNSALEYQVNFTPKSERDYTSHQRFAISLLLRLTPPHVLTFIGKQPDIMNALMTSLSGENNDSAIVKIVQRADQTSTKWNLSKGSRVKFHTATAVSLIDRLMDAVKKMLKAGGELPLNRDGAIGWVYEDCIWFVAKRLADSVRDYLLKELNQDKDGIPGPNKNDRFFDTWQEYGVVIPNPETGQAIWYVDIEGGDYSHSLTVLRFPLSKLFDTAAQYPATFTGRITVRKREDKKHKEENPATIDNHVCPSSDGTDNNPSTEPLESDHKQAIPAIGSESIIFKTDYQSPTINVKSNRSGTDRSEDTYIHPVDTAEGESKRFAQLKQGAAKKHAQTPMTPFVPTLPSLKQLNDQSKGEREPSEAAIRFMQWLQQGVADGSIKYNEVNAPVHFVEMGMLLISPRIFREFALQFGEVGDGVPSDKMPDKVGTGIQRQIINAGWHLMGEKKSNILHFSVIKRGGVAVSKLSGIVIKQPERWFFPVPLNNPNIVPTQITCT